ncbi:hypothetical protein BZA05DRAFT_338359 [Tricharina praecox]|uniref:uncharacterized protein n=1 Tax=Tricharina praecox TaxID=43433 RepID=UPI00221FF028|nr:uncharacterized protein BZA05DRAFT_338359 [Tricharina praecox]KAI5850797.1 hypothetical protein BZA05DRAFT_338359 [Tricharina praecox]
MSIPVISLTGRRDVVVASLRDACLRYGFAQLTDSSITPALTSDVFTVAKRFFSLPLATKNALSKLSHYSAGYDSYKKYTLEIGGVYPDLNEGFVIGKLNSEGSCWPDTDQHPELADFRSTCEAFQEALHGVVKEVAEIIAEGLGLPSGHFDEFFVDENGNARLTHYICPDDAEDDEGSLGCGEHTDWGLLTLLVQDEVGGLQVQDVQTGEWLDVTPMPGALVFNAGDMLARFTNGVYVSAKHRVIRLPKGVERYSIPFFSVGADYYFVDVLPLGSDWVEWVREKKGDPPTEDRLFQPILAGEYLALKFHEVRDAKAEGEVGA